MTRKSHQEGLALIGVIVMLMFLSAMAATMAAKVQTDTQLRGTYGQAVTGFYAAESGLSQGMGEFKTKFLNYGVPSGSDFNPRTSTMGKRSVGYQLFEKSGNPRNITIPAGQLFAGLNSLEYGYTVKSAATNINNGDKEASVGAEFLVGNIPLFQFVAFYNRDLEILPGADMTLRGRVHTNGNLYLNTESGRTFRIIDDYNAGITTVQVTSKGAVHRGRKNASSCAGTVIVDMLEDKVSPLNDLDPRTLSCIGSGTSAVPVSTLSQWKGSIVGNIESISVPEPDIITRNGAYWSKAELRIALLLDTPGQLPGGPWLPARIEVQDASGSQDAVRTALLQTFMLGPNPTTGTYANGAPSSLTGTLIGTRPLFYTDVPVQNHLLALSGAQTCTCSDTAPGCNNTNPSCYPQLDPLDLTRLSTSRYIGCPGGTGECNRAGQSLGSATFDRTYTSNGFTGSAAFLNLPGMAGDLDYRRGGFYNWRERKWMYLLNLNVADLLQWNRFQPSGSRLFNNGDTSDGGLILYLTVIGPNANGVNNYGVRIFGSQNLWFPTNPGPGLDPTGITIVSDQAMYVQGHFNQGNQAASPYGDPAAPAGNLPKQPAAFLADSVNVLSTSYFSNVGCRNDCQSSRGLGDATRAATTTWVNAGFLGGVDDTVGSNYNGGLENYPRFHESWSGNTLTYWGSFVSLGTPRHVDGPWCGTGSTCNIYNPPNRSYNYDPFFNNVANLPPLTPRFVYVQQVLFTEDFL